MTFGAPPESGRPSVCATMALETVQFACSGSAGELWNVPDSMTSIFGMT